MDMEREPKEDVEVEHDTTIRRLRNLLDESPDVFGDQLESIRQAVENAEVEMKNLGQLSEATREELDNLYRPFKPEFLK